MSVYSNTKVKYIVDKYFLRLSDDTLQCEEVWYALRNIDCIGQVVHFLYNNFQIRECWFPMAS